ncbi:MAG: TonB family protein [Gammaproteobacteria bacterium]|nr:TonB family protein [Gammaproteobacteria bacterium]
MLANRTDRRFIILVLAIAVWASGAWADDRADFNAAYRAYEQHLDARDAKQALEAAKEAHRAGSKLFGKDSVNTAKLAINYAALLNDFGHYRKARRALDGTQDVFRARYGEGAVELVPIMMQLARSAKAPEDTLEYFRRAARLSRGYDDNLVEAEKNFEIMSILLRMGGGAFVEPYVDRTYEIYSERLEPNDFRLGLVSYHKARWATGRGHHEQALDYLSGALTAFTNPERERMGGFERTVRMQIVEALEELGQRDASTEHLLLLGAQQDWSPEVEPVYRRDPVVPMDAMAKRLKGQVTVSFTVDEQGFVVDPEVSESTQPTLNDATLAMVKGFRYAPRFIDGNPVATAGIEYTEDFAFLSSGTGLARPLFERPPIRGFTNIDFNDMSECSKPLPDERVCGFMMPGRK